MVSHASPAIFRFPPLCTALPCCPMPPPTVFRRPPLVSVVFCFFSTIACRPPTVPHRPPPALVLLPSSANPPSSCRPPPSPVVLPSPAVLSHRRPPTVLRHPLLSPITLYKNMSQIVRLVVLPNHGHPGNSRTKTDGIVLSHPVIFSSCPTSKNKRQGWTRFCRPVSSRALSSPPTRP